MDARRREKIKAEMKEGEGAKEKLLVKLYRALSLDEREDLAGSLRLLLKCVKRKKVRDTFDRLKKYKVWKKLTRISTEEPLGKP